MSIGWKDLTKEFIIDACKRSQTQAETALALGYTIGKFQSLCLSFFGIWRWREIRVSFGLPPYDSDRLRRRMQS